MNYSHFKSVLNKASIPSLFLMVFPSAVINPICCQRKCWLWVLLPVLRPELEPLAQLSELKFPAANQWSK